MLTGKQTIKVILPGLGDPKIFESAKWPVTVLKLHKMVGTSHTITTRLVAQIPVVETGFEGKLTITPGAREITAGAGGVRTLKPSTLCDRVAMLTEVK